MNEKALKIIVAAFIVFIAIFLDQWTKFWAEDNLANLRYPDHYVSLTITDQNPGTLGDVIQTRYPKNTERENKLILANVYRDGTRLMPQAEVKTGETLELHHVGLTVIDGYYDYQYARNPGAAFSFMANASPTTRFVFFGITGILAILLIGVFIWRTSWKNNKVMVISLACVLGGAIGNVIDRFRLSYVVDFISWHVEDHYWPTFNIADVFVTGGVIFLILTMAIQSFQNRKAVPAEGAESEDKAKEESAKSDDKAKEESAKSEDKTDGKTDHSDSSDKPSEESK